MRALGAILQVVFFLLLVGVSLLAAGIIMNRLPLTEPPGLLTRLSTYLNTNVAETSEDSPFPELHLSRYKAPPELLFDVVSRTVKGLGWETTTLDADKKEIQAIVTSKMLRFKDDVTIRIQPAQPSGSSLWVRSVSRVGKGDLGANTRHVLSLVQAVNATVPREALVTQPSPAPAPPPQPQRVHPPGETQP